MRIAIFLILSIICSCSTLQTKVNNHEIKPKEQEEEDYCKTGTNLEMLDLFCR